MNTPIGANHFPSSTAVQTGFHIGPHDRASIEDKPIRLLGNAEKTVIRKRTPKSPKEGTSGLAGDRSQSGKRSGHFQPEERALLEETIRASYLAPERKTIAATTDEVKRAFADENDRRAEQGLAPLRTPSRETVRTHIRKLDKLPVITPRNGAREAMRRMRTDDPELKVERPLQRVEMDEWRIDLASIFHGAELHQVFRSGQRETTGLSGEKAPWWLVVAMDRRTRIILGIKLTREPNASAAAECLRMVLSDKGQWSDAVGALTPWSQAGVPERLVTDNGSGFRSSAFRNTCTVLGITLERTAAGAPEMRRSVERFFRTATIHLKDWLRGRTFDVVQTGDHSAGQWAPLGAEDLSFALTRWVVDVYHNTPHASLGGRTPLEQWDADMVEGS